MTEAQSGKQAQSVPLELPSDVKKFILAYPPFARSLDLTNRELANVYSFVESRIAHEDWFAAQDFDTVAGKTIYRVWKKRWHGTVTPGCPWVNMVFRLRLDVSAIETRLQIDNPEKLQPSILEDLAKDVVRRLSEAGFDWLTGQGWILREPPPFRSAIAERQEPCDEATFSASWMVTNAVEQMSQLATTIPHVDAAITDMFA